MATPLTVNGNVLLTASEAPSPDASGTKYIYISSTETISKSRKEDLAAKGVTITEYLGNNTYLCRYVPSDLEPIRQLGVQASVYPRHVKTTTALKEAVQAGEQGDSTPRKYKVDVVLHKGENNVNDVVTQITTKTGLTPDDIDVKHNIIRLDVDADTISKLEEVDAVKTIEKVVPKKFFNNTARNDMGFGAVEPPHTTYTGKDQIVVIADTGFDEGRKEDCHPAFTNRVVDLVSVGRKRSGKTNDYDGHGTHVAGSVLGSHTSAKMGGAIKGTAPEALMVMQSLLDTRGGLDVGANLWDLFQPPYGKEYDEPFNQHKARIATNSWGPGWIGQQIGYDSDANALDAFVWKNQDHVILFAAGNDGMELSATNAHIGSTSGAANCISVGATYSSRTAKGFKYDPDGRPGKPDKVAEFSSRGPTTDGLIKPDVVAPGVPILSACSRDPAITEAARQRGGPTEDELWMFLAGTSMATPLVAGCCAVLREALWAVGVSTSSAALIKALLVNGADDLGLPRSHQGFGRVNIKNSLLSVEGRRSGSGDFVDQRLSLDLEL
ncbi:KP-43 peptidase, serine peptidase, MEROPS family S08A [Purpureocillium lilacinum]|uniref:KP-43 peptidase, serine peptidase, MEROPS family S08A n=1 Tax=Purpureocillium lilacinum TaxID=33203 RepID=A0A179I1J9_PURLI|nr:KP-43 peptidase, serine peptidase, MEROPS family S08A [Purpureocillium lilacinum]OAQ95520.1 KP-43 peptidase, serine peptidase, MEROPS family S08A [Purpureocillium lilacinum]